MSDLKKAFDAITAKQKPLTQLINYYHGEQPMVYTSKRLVDVFGSAMEDFTENWCGVVVDSIKERMTLKAFDAGAAQATLDKIIEANQLYLEAADLHEMVLAAGHAYLHVWDEGNGVEIYFNDPRQCVIFYDPQRPRIRTYAAKLWTDERAHITLYYPDRFEYYISRGKGTDVTEAGAFELDTSISETGTAVNETGGIPLFEFCGNRQKKSDLSNVIKIQNGINKLLGDMMVAAEYGAFRQRWIISNSDITKLRNAPNEIWNLPGGDGVGQQTQVGEFSPTDLGNYLNAIDRLAGDIARVTRLPKHYFYSQGGDPSGEALMAMEAPLIKRVKSRIERIEPTWQQAMAFALQCAGITGEAKPIWDSVESVQPVTQADIRVKNKSAGIPLRSTLRWEGRSDQEIADVEADIVAEQTAANSNLAKALLEQQRQFDQGNVDQGNGVV